MLAEDIWNIEKQRITLLEQKGYMVKVIWEDDYNNDKEKVISECLNFLAQ